MMSRPSAPKMRSLVSRCVGSCLLGTIGLVGCAEQTSETISYSEAEERAVTACKTEEVPASEPAAVIAWNEVMSREPIVAARPISRATEVSQITEPVSMSNSMPDPTDPELIAARARGELVVDSGSDVIEKREIKLLVPEKEFDTTRPRNALRVSYDDLDLLKILNMDPVVENAVDYFPDWLKELDGKTIRIRGFMFPTSSFEGLEGFTLARDNGICCFQRRAKPYDVFPVILKEGTTTSYIEGRPFDVVGVFSINPYIPYGDDQIRYLYQIDDAEIISR